MHRDLSGPDVAVAFQGFALKVHSPSSTQRGDWKKRTGFCCHAQRDEVPDLPNASTVSWWPGLDLGHSRGWAHKGAWALIAGLVQWPSTPCVQHTALGAALHRSCHSSQCTALAACVVHELLQVHPIPSSLPAALHCKAWSAALTDAPKPLLKVFQEIRLCCVNFCCCKKLPQYCVLSFY